MTSQSVKFANLFGTMLKSLDYLKVHRSKTLRRKQHRNFENPPFQNKEMPTLPTFNIHV